jgi:hypothetical protein
MIGYLDTVTQGRETAEAVRDTANRISGLLDNLPTIPHIPATPSIPCAPDFGEVPSLSDLGRSRLEDLIPQAPSLDDLPSIPERPSLPDLSDLTDISDLPDLGVLGDFPVDQPEQIEDPVEELYADVVEEAAEPVHEPAPWAKDEEQATAVLQVCRNGWNTVDTRPLVAAWFSA